MLRIVVVVCMVSSILSATAMALEIDLNTPAMAPFRAYLDQHKLKLTPKAADAQKSGYILVIGSGKGAKSSAQIAAKADAQRQIAAVMAEIPSNKPQATKQITKSNQTTKTVVSGKVSHATTLFSHYDENTETMQILMRRILN